MIKKIRQFLANRKLKNILSEIQYAQASIDFWGDKLAALSQEKSNAEYDLLEFSVPRSEYWFPKEVPITRKMMMDAQKKAQGVELQNSKFCGNLIKPSENSYAGGGAPWQNGADFPNYYPRFEQRPDVESDKF